MSRPHDSLPPTSDAPRSLQHGVRKRLRTWRKLLVYGLVLVGIVLLLRFGPGAMLILVPIGVLLFGSALYAWARFKFRKKR
jgi:uncharacterized membrane protein